MIVRDEYSGIFTDSRRVLHPRCVNREPIVHPRGINPRIERPRFGAMQQAMIAQRISTSATAFVQSNPVAAPRSGAFLVGCKFTVGGASLAVTQLGRWVISGNNQTHRLRIVRVSDLVEMCNVTVNCSGAAVGWLYGAATCTLAASTAYYVDSDEGANVDTWIDEDTYTVSSAITINNSCYVPVPGSPTAFNLGSAGKIYVPVNITYN